MRLERSISLIMASIVIAFLLYVVSLYEPSLSQPLSLLAAAVFAFGVGVTIYNLMLYILERLRF